MKLASMLLLGLQFLIGHIAYCQTLNLDFTQPIHYPFHWNGDTSKFIRHTGYLQSNSDLPNDQFAISRTIELNSPFQLDAELELKLKTSSLNYVDIILYGIQNDSIALQIRLGGSQDDLRLFSIQNGEEELLIDGPDKMTEQAHIHVGLIHHESGLLHLNYKQKDSSSFIQAGSYFIQDLTFYKLELRIRQSSQSFHKKHFIHHLYLGDIIQDTTPPSLQNTLSSGKTNWLFKFSEPILTDLTTISVNGIETQFVHQNSASISVPFKETIAESWYDVHISGVRDTAGNLMSDTALQFLHYLSKSIPYNGIVINEILFDPYPNGIDFIELYNNTDSFYELNDLMIGRISQNQIVEQQLISPIKMSFAPHSYLLLSENDSSICSQYSCPSPLYSMELDLPRMNNDSGEILLYTSSHTIDFLKYMNDWHTELLLNSEGVSLERINPNAPTNNKNNWHSATALCGFASPAAENSMYHLESESLGFSLHNSLITPNGDGIQDLLLLEYSFDKPSYLSSYIYDLNGVMIWQWHNNELLAFNGTLKWDLFYLNRLLSNGHYILFLKAFNLDGELLKKKLPFTVASQY
ncbi:MAG: lamin tail domain-containing protein [Bacteroidia bacterium]